MGDRVREEIAAFGRVLGVRSGEPYVELPGRAAARAALHAAAIRTGGPPAVVLGDHGTGKTALLRSVGRRLAAEGWIAFEASASEIQAGQSFVGELEGRLQELHDYARARKVAWLLPDLLAAISAGSYTSDPRGVLARVMPYLEEGRLRLLTEATPDNWAVVGQKLPRFAALAQTVRIAPLDRDETLAVATGWLQQRGARAPAAVVADAVDAASRHLASAAPPGGALRLLRAALRRSEERGTAALEASDLLPAVAELTGLPLDVLDGHRRLDLSEVSAFFAERVMGQPDAVRTLVERIAMIKAGLVDPTRPLGVFLFVGPTGTGKTELAKALAEYLFGSPGRLVRLDMSEFQTAESLERLLAPAGSDETAGLLDAVRRAPFSVVLLDEVEKAHPRIWDAFLALFDDARMTDRSGATVDFRHCVVILTSNAGSGDGAGGGAVGFVTPACVAPADPGRALAATFRPEFLNRLDRIVVFRPLSREVMRRLVAKELGAIAQRRGLRDRPWAVEWDASAVEVILRRGFTREMGARPLRRAVEEHVLAPLARAIVQHQVPEGDQFLLVHSGNGRRIDVDFIDPDIGEIRPAGADAPAATAKTLQQVALDPTGAPEELRLLRERAAAVAGVVRGPAWSQRKAAALAALGEPAFWASEDRYATLAVAELIDRAQAGLASADRLLHRLGSTPDPALTRRCALRLHVLEAAIAAVAEDAGMDAWVRVSPAGTSAADDDAAGRVQRMLEDWSDERGMRLEAVDPGVVSVSGFGAFRLLDPENGLHVFELPGSKRAVRATARVAVAPQAPGPGGYPRRSAHAALDAMPAAATDVRRYREAPSPLVRDARGWRTGRLDRVLAGDFDLF